VSRSGTLVTGSGVAPDSKWFNLAAIPWGHEIPHPGFIPRVQPIPHIAIGGSFTAPRTPQAFIHHISIMIAANQATSFFPHS